MALQNNFDTPSALNSLLSLISSTNQYMVMCNSSSNNNSNGFTRPSATLLRKIGNYITQMFAVFGVIDENDKIGFHGSGSKNNEVNHEDDDGDEKISVSVDAEPVSPHTDNASQTVGVTDKATTNQVRKVQYNKFDYVVDALVKFRDAIREEAKHNESVRASFLPLCDALRDEKLIHAGIRL